MVKKQLILVWAFLAVLRVNAQESPSSVMYLTDEGDDRVWTVGVRAGYALGGTVPTEFPYEMRGMNGYTPKFNYSVGVDVERRLNERFGIQTGVRFERHAFRTDVRMRQYDITLSHGGEMISGPFTGNVVINISQTGFTIPVQGTWHFSNNGMLKFGPYCQLLTGRGFSGYAYGNKVYDENGKWTGGFDAYLRRDEVRGERVEIGDIYVDENGNTVDKRGTFEGDEYNDYLRWFQWGLNVGCDYSLTSRWGVFADLSYGMNSAFTNEEGNPVSMKLHPMYFTAGMTCRLGK